MIRFQIIERTGANLQKTLVDAMRAGELRTFEATRRGRRIQQMWSARSHLVQSPALQYRKAGLLHHPLL